MAKMIRRIFPLKSIYTKLFILFSIIGVIPLILGSFYAYYSSREALFQAALKEHELEVNSGIRNILILFVESSVNLRLGTQNTAFVRYFEKPHERSIYKEEQENVLLQIGSLFPEVIGSVGFIDVNGKVISAVSNGKPVSPQNHITVLSHPFFRQALRLQKGEVYYAPPEFSQASQKWVISGATPVFNREGRLYGVLYVQIYLNSITRLIKNIAHPDDIVFIVDQGGHLIAHTRRNVAVPQSLAFQPNDHPSYQTAIAHMMAGNGGSMRILYDGGPSYITYRDIPEEGDNQNRWGIGVITSEETIYKGVSTRRYLIFILSTSAALFAVAGILGWRIASPIKELTLTSVAMSKGDIRNRVKIKGEDEIGQLARAFNEMASSIQTSHEELIRLSTVDGLTGLYNYREFQKRLEEEIRRASRYGHVLSLLMIDIDNFKKFNDTYGHPAGDTVLQSIGASILKEIRISDFAARYGGEEIAIIAPEIDSAEALIFSERFRENIQQLLITVSGDKTVHVTISIGIASFPQDAHDRKRLIDAADQALYFAKDKGRNKTILYSETLKAILEQGRTETQTLLEQAEDKKSKA